MPLPKQKLTYSESLPIFAYDSPPEKPSTQRHDLDDLAPGVDDNTLRIPGDLSDAWELRANPSYAKTLRDNDIQTRAPLPAEDDGEKPAALAPLDPDAIRSLLTACHFAEQGKLAPKDFCQLVRMVLTDGDLAEDAEQRLIPPAKAMDARMAHDAAGASNLNKRFPNAARIGRNTLGDR